MQRHVSAALLVLIYLILFVSLAYADQNQKKRGKLKKFEEAVGKTGKKKEDKKEKKNENKKKKKRNSNRHKSQRGYSGSPVSSIAVEILSDPESATTLFTGLGGVFFGVWPKESSLYNPSFWHTGYALYPYHKSNTGLYTSGDGFGSAIRVSGHYLFNSPDLQGYQVRSHFSPSPLFDIAVHVTGLTETFDDSDDHLALYDAYLNYNRIRHQYISMWWGGGLKTLSGDQTYHGPAINAGIELYPLKPFSVHASANVGRLNATAVWDTLIRLNIHVYRSALYFGYQRFDVKNISVDGIIGGLGLYF